MAFYISSSLTPTHFWKPLNPFNTLSPFQFRGSLSSFVRRRKPEGAKLSCKVNMLPSRRDGLLISCCSTSSFESPESSVSREEDAAFERIREAEGERVSNMEELERKANVQLERQLVMASDWSRTLLTMRGKLKGTEWDPEISHRINFSDFTKLLDSNSVQYMEYSNYRKTISGHSIARSLK